MSHDELGTPGILDPSRRWSRWVNTLGPLLGLVLLLAVFALLVWLKVMPPSFLTATNFEDIARQSTIVGIAALGMTMVIIAAGIDLSVGSVIALASVVIAVTLTATTTVNGRSVSIVSVHPVAWPLLAAGLGVLAGALAGLGNGLLITTLRVVPFIVTLGTLLIVRGLAKGFAASRTVYPDSTWLDNLLASAQPGGRTWLLPPGLWLLIAAVVAVWTMLRRRLGRLTVMYAVVLAVLAAGAFVQLWFILPPGVCVLVALSLVVAAVLRYTRLGRHTFAIGSNEQTARLCGVAVGRVKVLVYTICGLTAGLAGLMEFSRITGGDPTTAQGRELDVIAAVVIGGGSLFGGEGSVLGTLVGVLIIKTIGNGLTQMNIPTWVQEIVTGSIIVLAVALDRLRHRRAM